VNFFKFLKDKLKDVKLPASVEVVIEAVPRGKKEVEASITSVSEGKCYFTVAKFKDIHRLLETSVITARTEARNGLFYQAPGNAINYSGAQDPFNL